MTFSEIERNFIIMFNIEIFLSSLMWFVYLLFSYSLLSQIFLNLKRKKLSGMDSNFLLLTFVLQIILCLYSYLQDLPLVYKVMNPIYLFLILILFGQRFYFLKSKKNRRKFLHDISRNLFFMGLVLIFFSFSPFKKDMIGWLFVGINALKNSLQAFKIYSRKSVRGLSFSFLMMTTFSYFIEMILALLMGLPIQIIFNDFKSIFIYCIMLCMYNVYKNKKNKEVKEKEVSLYA